MLSVRRSSFVAPGFGEVYPLVYAAILTAIGIPARGDLAPRIGVIYGGPNNF